MHLFLYATVVVGRSDRADRPVEVDLGRRYIAGERELVHPVEEGNYLRGVVRRSDGCVQFAEPFRPAAGVAADPPGESPAGAPTNCKGHERFCHIRAGRFTIWPGVRSYARMGGDAAKLPELSEAAENVPDPAPRRGSSAEDDRRAQQDGTPPEIAANMAQQFGR